MVIPPANPPMSRTTGTRVPRMTGFPWCTFASNDNSLSHLLSLQDTFLHRTEEPQKSQSRRKGFDWLGYHISPVGLRLAATTIHTFATRLTRLYEQEAGRPNGAARLGQYVRRWMGWATGSWHISSGRWLSCTSATPWLHQSWRRLFFVVGWAASGPGWRPVGPVGRGPLALCARRADASFLWAAMLPSGGPSARTRGAGETIRTRVADRSR